MASHALLHGHRRPHRTETRLVRLGWTHFWLLGGVLAGMLALIAMVFVVLLAER